jgi:Integrase core domain
MRSPGCARQARVTLGCWRAHYNDARPHSQLGWKVQSEFAVANRDGIWRCATPKAPSLKPPHRATQTQRANSALAKTGGNVTTAANPIPSSQTQSRSYGGLRLQPASKLVAAHFAEVSVGTKIANPPPNLIGV